MKKATRMRRSLIKSAMLGLALSPPGSLCLARRAVAGIGLSAASLLFAHRPRTARQSQQIKLGLNKSMIVELPREVREVMVSNPEQIDAVLQTSTRAYLIGKAAGEANIIFIDKDGKQVATLEVTVERDLVAPASSPQPPHSRLEHPRSDA